jgi:Ser/Thr protein kinase RdoA (MazF antagonist)
MAMVLLTFSTDFIQKLLSSRYKIDAHEISALKGHCDSNFLVTSSAQKWVLKMKTTDEEELRAQLAFMQHLRDEGFCVPEIVPTLNGELFFQLPKHSTPAGS